MLLRTIVGLSMNLQRTTLFLTVAAGVTIQLLGSGGAIAADEEPAVPVDSAVNNPASASVDSEPTNASLDGRESNEIRAVPARGESSDNGALYATSESNSSSFVPPDSDSPPSDSGFTSGSLNSTPLMGTVERKSIEASPPDMRPPGMISPMVPYSTPGGAFPQQPVGPMLQMEKQRPAAEPERESKGGFLGKLSKSLLMGGANKNVPAAERPWWIPGHAFTDDSMVAPYHNLDIAWWDKRPMPNRPQWVRLSTSVTRYWRGSVPEPCMVLVAPIKQVPGNFTFRSRSFGGPRGWLQALNVPDRKGFPQYRYWLDQP